MPPLDFISQYIHVGYMLTGLALLAISAGITKMGGGKGDDKATNKFAVRVICAVLAAAGVFGILWSIHVFGYQQALTVGLLILFLGMVWSIGAEGLWATVLGIIFAIIAFSALAAAFRSLPLDSPIAQFLDNSWTFITGLFPEDL